MALLHVPPSVVDKQKLNRENLVFATRKLANDHEHPGARIIAHFIEVTERSWLGKVNQTHYGRLFEICVYDALVYYGVSPNRITPHVDMTRGKHAELDFLIRGEYSAETGTQARSVGLLLKTSLRERWKQMDRDALVVADVAEAISAHGGFPGHVFPPRLACVFFRENKEDTRQSMVRKSISLQGMFKSTAQLYTILDPEHMRQLFRECGATQL